MYLDETYYTVASFEIVTHKNVKKKRGISQNKYCIITACDTGSAVGVKTSKVHPTKETKGEKNTDNTMFAINHIHFLLKRFLNAHSSFDREDLQDYLNLFCFIMNPPEEEQEKVAQLLN